MEEITKERKMEEKWNEMREISDDNEHDKVRQINDEKKKLCDE